MLPVMIKDLSPMVKDIVDVMKAHGVDDPAIAIAFTAKNENYSTCHWATNVSRKDGITLFTETAENMRKDSKGIKS